MKFTLRQLEVFFAVGRLNSVSKAAEDLHLTQSATSMALADLERQTNTQLFDRIGKRLVLNSLGQELLPKVKALLDRASELEGLFDTNLEASPFNLGATLTIGNYLATPLIAEYWQKFPNSKVNIQVHNTTEIIKRLSQLELDVALIEGECHHADLQTEEWMTDELMIFAAPNHPLVNKADVTFQDLLAEKWILRETGSGTRQLFDQATQRHHSRLNILMELEHTEGIKRAVEAGMGVGCISQVALKDAFQRGSLQPIYIQDIKFHRHFYLVTHKQKYLNKNVAEFIRLCREHKLQ